MIRIGLVDLDTSHPAAWLPIIRSHEGAQVTAVFDGEAVHDPGYAHTFAQQHQIPHVFESLAEMAQQVDAAIIHSCNWDVHVERAKPFVEAGKPVFLDKPVIGNLRDAMQLREWVMGGAQIIGGSSLRYVPEVAAFTAANPPQSVKSIFATCPNDLFNYGIHAYELVAGAIGSGIEWVRHLGGKGVSLIQLVYRDGRQAMLQLQTPAGRFHFTASTESGIHSVNVSTSNIYVPLIDHIIAHFTGKRPFPIDLEQMLEPCLAAIAADVSRRKGERVFLDSLRLDEAGYDGHAFAAEYRLQRRKALAAAAARRG